MTSSALELVVKKENGQDIAPLGACKVQFLVFSFSGIDIDWPLDFASPPGASNPEAPKQTHYLPPNWSPPAF